MKIGCWLLMAVAVLAGSRPVAAPISARPVPPGSCQFSELYRQDGWTVPGLAGARPKGARMAVEGRPGAFLTDLRAGKTTGNLLLLTCSGDAPGRLLFRSRPVRVLSLSKIEVNGKLFGYYAEYELQMITGGVPQRSLEFARVLFTDSDGAGKLRVLRYGGMDLLMELLKQ